MTEVAIRQDTTPAVYANDPTGGRLVAWAGAASAANQLAKALSSTDFCPQHFRGKPGEATAAIIAGDELGLPPLAALRSIYVVHGTPAMYARTMRALALSHGHEMWTESATDAKVVVCGRRRGTDHVERSEWTIARAQKAGYTSNKKYQSSPIEMLRAKADAEVARLIAADVLAGIPYSVEDLELEDVPTTKVTREPRKVQRAAPPPPAEPEFDPEPTPDPEPDADVELIRPAQMRKMQALFSEKGFRDREDRLAYVQQVVEIDVASSKDLTVDQASRVIDALDQLSDVTDADV